MSKEQNKEQNEGLNEGLCEDEESRKYYTEVILDESEKMNNMVKQLLTLSSLESGNSILHKENFNLTSLIESVLGSISILIGEKDVNIIFDSSKDIYIHADEFKIEEVVTNYISNSIHHVKDSGEIKINVSDDGENITFSVYNTGNPIPEKDLKKVNVASDLDIDIDYARGTNLETYKEENIFKRIISKIREIFGF